MKSKEDGLRGHYFQWPQVIVHYPEDKPHPSRLLLGLADGRPLHVVLAYDGETAD